MEELFLKVRTIIVLALPTFATFLLLFFFLKKMLWQPLEQTLEERRRRTLGAVEGAEAILAEVEKKAAAYEKALLDARSEIYREQEAHRQSLAKEQTATIEAARARVTVQVNEAKAGIVAEAQAAKDSLRSETERLAEQIAQAVLAGKANG